ncbi:MAG: hypothetical protein ACKO0M_11940 [Cyanobium sp.]
MHTPPFQPYQPFDGSQWQPHHPSGHWQPCQGMPSPSPAWFHVGGPSGYHGWGWSAELSPNISYTQYNDNRGGHYTLWRQNPNPHFQ